MAASWNLVHPRFVFWLHLGRPRRAVGVILTLGLFLLLAAFAVVGGVYGVGRLGYGPFVADAMREKEFSSIMFGAGVSAIFALLTFYSLLRQWRDSTRDCEMIEGNIQSLKEDYDITDGGKSEYLLAIIRGKEYILPIRLKKYLKAGQNLRIQRWAASGDVRAVWVAW